MAYIDKLAVDGQSSPECSAEYPRCDVSGFECLKRTVASIADKQSDGYKSALAKDSLLVEGNIKYWCVPHKEAKDLAEITG